MAISDEHKAKMKAGAEAARKKKAAEKASKAARGHGDLAARLQQHATLCKAVVGISGTHHMRNAALKDAVSLMEAASRALK